MVQIGRWLVGVVIKSLWARVWLVGDPDIYARRHPEHVGVGDHQAMARLWKGELCHPGTFGAFGAGPCLHTNRSVYFLQIEDH